MPKSKTAKRKTPRGRTVKGGKEHEITVADILQGLEFMEQELRQMRNVLEQLVGTTRLGEVVPTARVTVHPPFIAKNPRISGVC